LKITLLFARLLVSAGRICHNSAVEKQFFNANDPATDDKTLMELTRAGRQGAFEELIRRHQPALVNYFARMGVYNNAEDLTQETFIKVFNYRHRYRPTAKFTTFLYTIARNVFLDNIRKTRREKTSAELLQADWMEPEGNKAAGLRLKLDVKEALDQLSEKLRSVVVLSYWQGLRYDEIAGVLGIPPGTVKSRMFHALNRLKEIFDREKPGQC
jgi:RNA polymerase sigma-70 factor (ECF subfamily)